MTSQNTPSSTIEKLTNDLNISNKLDQVFVIEKIKNAANHIITLPDLLLEELSELGFNIDNAFEITGNTNQGEIQNKDQNIPQTITQTYTLKQKSFEVLCDYIYYYHTKRQLDFLEQTSSFNRETNSLEHLLKQSIENFQELEQLLSFDYTKDNLQNLRNSQVQVKDEEGNIEEKNITDISGVKIIFKEIEKKITKKAILKIFSEVFFPNMFKLLNKSDSSRDEQFRSIINNHSQKFAHVMGVDLDKSGKLPEDQLEVALAILKNTYNQIHVQISKLNIKKDSFNITLQIDNPGYLEQKDKAERNKKNQKLLEQEKSEQDEENGTKSISNSKLKTYLGAAIITGLFTVGGMSFYNKEDNNEPIEQTAKRHVLSENERIKLLNTELFSIIQNEIENYKNNQTNIFVVKDKLGLKLPEILDVIFRKNHNKLPDYNLDYTMNTTITNSGIEVSIVNSQDKSESYIYNFSYDIIMSPFSTEEQGQRIVDFTKNKIEKLKKETSNISELSKRLEEHVYNIAQSGTFMPDYVFNISYNRPVRIDENNCELKILFHNTVTKIDIETSHIIKGVCDN